MAMADPIVHCAPDLVIGIEGLQLSFNICCGFVVTQLLKSPQGAKRLLNILVLTGLRLACMGCISLLLR